MDRHVHVVSEGGSQPTETMPPVSAKEHRNQVCLDIGRFFYENGIPFHAATSPSFTSMLRSVGNFGRGLKPPTMHELRTWILKEEVKTTTEMVNDIKATWKTTGVSLLSDGWSDMRNRSLINFLVNNQYGTVFLKTVDASNCVKDADKIFELLDGVIEEIGEDIVVQVVTDNASNYKKAGEMLMKKRKKLYWTPCAAHCIDLMLEKIGELPQHKNALLKAKKVSNFIYNHNWVLSLARKILGKDLLRPAATRFATAFLTIQSLYDSKDALQQMFVSNDWKNCAWAKKDDGKNVKKIIMDERTFWPSVVYTLQTTSPLVEVLRIVDGEQTPAMGFLYGAMDGCKEKIAKNLNNVQASYKEIWDIIDEKWDFQMHRALHAAAYYLNPKFRWSPDVSQHPEIKRGLYDVMERLVKDNGVYMKIEEQLILYREKKGLFGYRGSLATYQTRPPVLWWGEYGDDTPELKAFAMKILGLTCSASACERNWSTFNQVHTKRRNRLTTERMDDLVFIMYNRKLKQKFVKRSNLKEDEDPLLVENVMSDDEWIADPSDDDDEDAIQVDAANVEESDEVIRTRGSRATKSRRGGGMIERGGGSSSSKKRKAALHLIDEADEDEDDEDWVEEDCEDDEDDVRYAI
ncbi:putative HAT dimerization domain, ribonuclease H-like superfamily [Helianthus debilis subsp. tardiflorus]